MGATNCVRLVCCLLMSYLSAATDLFLFAGQSNMVGWSTGVQSVEGNSSLFLDTMSILSNDSSIELEKRTQLQQRYLKATSSIKPAINPDGYAAVQADGVMSLYNMNLTQTLTSQLPGAYCSWTNPNRTIGKQQLVNSSGCGERFGHELMLSHRLKQSSSYINTDFYTVKVAKGGTRIHEWVPNGGQYWYFLQSAIEGTVGDWKLIVWHQGENDAFAPAGTMNETVYGNHLKSLISTIRVTMFAKLSSTFQCPEEIPVIIVQIHWPGNALALTIKQAQINFCAADSRATLVTIDDLDQFYHLSAPSLLISGNRIAEAYLTMINTDFSCPQSSSPSQIPTSEPSHNPSNPPSSATSNKPSRGPSYTPSVIPSEIPSKAPMAAFQPDFTNKDQWGRAIRKSCGCTITTTRTPLCVRRKLSTFFNIDVGAGLVSSPDDRYWWRRKVRRAYTKFCQLGGG